MYQVTTMYNICGKWHECLASEPATPTHKNATVFYNKDDVKIKIKELKELGIEANCSEFDTAWFMED